MFDELINYPEFENHEIKALYEFLLETDDFIMCESTFSLYWIFVATEIFRAHMLHHTYFLAMVVPNLCGDFHT